MKIRDLLGEEAVATIKDYKPGQLVSFSDPTGASMTTIDLTKNPTAIQSDEQGNLTYDPTPQATPNTVANKGPSIKPGAKINIDTSTTEGMGTNILASLAVVAGLLGINSMNEKEAFQNSPQLQKLVKMHADYSAKGDQAAVKQLEARIKAHKDRLSLDKGEVLDKTGNPAEVLPPDQFAKANAMRESTDDKLLKSMLVIAGIK